MCQELIHLQTEPPAVGRASAGQPAIDTMHRSIRCSGSLPNRWQSVSHLVWSQIDQRFHSDFAEEAILVANPNIRTIPQKRFTVFGGEGFVVWNLCRGLHVQERVAANSVIAHASVASMWRNTTNNDLKTNKILS